MKVTGKSLKVAADYIANLYRANLSIVPPAIPLQADQMWTDFMKAIPDTQEAKKNLPTPNKEDGDTFG